MMLNSVNIRNITPASAPRNIFLSFFDSALCPKPASVLEYPPVKIRNQEPDRNESSCNNLQQTFENIVIKDKMPVIKLFPFNPLPHNTANDTLKIHSCGKHCEKRRNCL